MLENSTPAFVMNHTSSSASWEIECTLSDEESRKDDATSKLNLWLARMGYIVCCCLLLFDRPKVRKDGAIWLSYGSIALTTAISISMVTLVVVYFMVLKVFRKAVVYSALVVASYDIAPKFNLRVKSSFSLFVIQGLTAPMQGFLNCIVYGWTRKSFREASETRAPLLDSADRSFFRSRRLLYGTASVRSL
ncbi:hypothetical protein P5673_000829 [Acropora cervicornis]|uniref:Uncharacterized protein n=1 Tax=Acropora cervicornis TaxID=6130 RepID=A0AAD9R7R9_ACRCE|nr:hypothetical protein P5673_000829 [Acropora cervicornis]